MSGYSQPTPHGYADRKDR